ncbi:MAG TPA: sodium-independent anion transporter, partial [Bryobacteraceae bacterium]|nr:sodium-independent anion transporter [Bryobacteraceae bacterium]
AFAGVVFLGTLQGILVAVVASLLSLAQQAYNPPVYVMGRKRGTSVFRRVSPDRPDDELWPGLLILRIEGRLFFANAQQVIEAMRSFIAQAKPRVVVLDCSSVIDIEFTAVRLLAETEQALRNEGIALWLAALNPSALEVVRRSKLGEALGHERTFFNLDTAVARFTAERMST